MTNIFVFSIALSKLQQKQALQEKLEKRRRHERDKLNKKQLAEDKKCQHEYEEDEEFEHVELMKRQAEEQLNILKRGSNLEESEVQNELDVIRESMMRERSIILKEQGEKLASMLADIQLKKAKEMIKMEEQQKAINKLKVNIMDDLTERGVLENPECREVIDNYQRDQEKINEILDVQRQKQERVRHFFLHTKVYHVIPFDCTLFA